MRFFAIILALALTVFVLQPQLVSAVGYERYDVSNGQISRHDSQQKGDVQKKEPFWNKCPAVLDNVSFFIRDVLSQFGLAEHRSR